MKKLPQNVQDFVFDGTWEERVNEIAKKYSLNLEQTDTLANDAVLVLIGLELPDTFLQTIISDLNISRLLAEQIMQDLEMRVFDYAIKELENSKRTVSKPAATPETPANNLPMVEKGEVAHDTKPQTAPAPKEKVPVPVYKPESSAEPVQKPFAVPRYTAAPEPEEKTSEEKPFSILEFVKKTPPTPPAPPAPPVPPKPATQTAPTSSGAQPSTQKPPQKYAADPYREPLN